MPTEWTNGKEPVDPSTDHLADTGHEAGVETCSCDHENPVCACHVPAAHRAAILREWWEAIESEWHGLRLMPLAESNKEPLIRKRGDLLDKSTTETTEDGTEYHPLTETATSLLHTPEEAIEAIRDGHPGFYIYAGHPELGTEDLVIVDRDEPDRWPDIPATLTVISGSGSSDHKYYRNAGNVHGARAELEKREYGVVTRYECENCLPQSRSLFDTFRSFL